MPRSHAPFSPRKASPARGGSAGSCHGRFRPLLARLISASFALVAGTACADNHYRFSPVNQYGIALTAEYWNPLIAQVAAQSGIKLTLKIGRTSADTTAYVLAQEVEFIFSNHMFSPEREAMGWKVFSRRTTPPVRSEIIVPKDSPVVDLAQLAGKSVGFPGPEATIAYRFSYGHLLEKAIPVTVVFGGNMDSALAQMFAGRVAAAGVNSQLADGYAKREGHQYRVLWASDPLHDLALMASANVPAKDVSAVARAFVDMHKTQSGRKVLEAASAKIKLPPDTIFIPSNGSEYEPYRRFYRNAPPQVR